MENFFSPLPYDTLFGILVTRHAQHNKSSVTGNYC